MDWLYGVEPFVWHPGRALAVALGLGLVGVAAGGRRRRPLLVAAGGWAVFALLEAEAWRARADIRVDLLFTWPALCVLTLACGVLWLRGSKT
jgi:hypothetical protein